jgi:hypothetical protein
MTSVDEFLSTIEDRVRAGIEMARQLEVADRGLPRRVLLMSCPSFSGQDREMLVSRLTLLGLILEGWSINIDYATFGLGCSTANPDVHEMIKSRLCEIDERVEEDLRAQTVDVVEMRLSKNADTRELIMARIKDVAERLVKRMERW